MKKFIPLLILILTIIFSCKKEKLAVKKGVSTQHRDSILKKELLLISVEDQTLRFLLPNVTEKFGNNSDEKKFIWSLIHKQDVICENKIIKILEQHGWVGKNRIGNKANQALWLVIQHASLETQEKYLPLLKESVFNDESESWHLAFLQDRILLRNKKKQLYGTQATWDNTLKKMKIYTIKDVQNVNKRREEIGLGTVEEHAKSNGYIFNQKE